MNTKPRSSEDLREFFAKREKASADAALQQELYLPSEVAEYQRAVPNGFIRSALFAALPRSKRTHLTREPLASLDGITITYTGVRLSQEDLTLWGNLVYAAREQKLGHFCVLSGYSILKMQGLKDTGGNRQVLYRQLAELNATALEIRQGHKTYTGSLIRSQGRDEELDRVVILFEPEIISLFGPNQYTRVDWEMRQRLSSPLAKWLHAFYTSHKVAFAYKVETLHRLCGSGAKDIKSFQRITLTNALKEVSGVFNEYGRFFNFALHEGKLYVSQDGKPLALPDAAKTRRKRNFGPSDQRGLF